MLHALIFVFNMIPCFKKHQGLSFTREPQNHQLYKHYLAMTRLTRTSKWLCRALYSFEGLSLHYMGLNT